MIYRPFLAILHMAFCEFVKITSLNGLDYNFGEHKKMILFMPCRKKCILLHILKKIHSTSYFLLVAFGLIFINIKPTS
jgi:hypothetical protein